MRSASLLPDSAVRELFRRRRIAAPPEMDQGTLGVTAPDGSTVAKVYTISLGGNQFTEHWVVYDPNFLNGGDCTFTFVCISAANRGGNAPITCG